MVLSVGVMTAELSGTKPLFLLNTDNKYSEYLTYLLRIKKAVKNRPNGGMAGNIILNITQD